GADPGPKTRLRKREDATDDRGEAPARGGLQAFLHVVGRLAGRPDDSDLVVVEVVDVERHDAAAVPAGRDQAPVPGDGREGLGEETGIADVLEHDVDAAVLGDAQDFRRQVLAAGVDAG